MRTNSTSPYLPSSDVEEPDTPQGSTIRFRDSLISAGVCVIAGIALVVSMAVADFDTETIILFTTTLLLLVLSLAVFFLRLRIVVPMYLLVPFLIVVAGRHVGDMGSMHFIDGGIYVMGCLAFSFAIATATIAKTVVYRVQRQPAGNHRLQRSP